MSEFVGFPKIARLNRDIIITEKIDGTNAAIGVEPLADNPDLFYVYAQSRKRIITPDNDNFGFAAWVASRSDMLAEVLGPGLHFGEWWGSGIQRGYGLTGGVRRFSLFDTARFGYLIDVEHEVNVVPVLYEGSFDQTCIQGALAELGVLGSLAAPGYMNPEGIVVYHTAARVRFKVTLEGDDKPKGQVE